MISHTVVRITTLIAVQLYQELHIGLMPIVIIQYVLERMRYVSNCADGVCVYSLANLYQDIQDMDLQLHGGCLCICLIRFAPTKRDHKKATPLFE